MPVLLSIDAGLKAGLAWFDDDGRLLKSRSAHFANRTILKRALAAVFAEVPGVSCVVLEGMGPIAEIWLKHAEKLAIPHWQVCAEEWRQDMLFLRERRSGAQAKLNAERIASDIATAGGLSRTAPMGNDEAEAILCGLWAAQKLKAQTRRH